MEQTQGLSDTRSCVTKLEWTDSGNEGQKGISRDSVLFGKGRKVQRRTDLRIDSRISTNQVGSYISSLLEC